MATKVNARLESEVNDFRSLQRKATALANSRAQFLTQMNENQMVLKELEILEDDAEVFKLIGPTLIKQEKSEAVSNVKKRIEFITTEVQKIEKTNKDLEAQQEEKRKVIIELQQQLQSAAK